MKLTRDALEEIMALHQSGKTAVEIADKTGFHPQNILMWLRPLALLRIVRPSPRGKFPASIALRAKVADLMRDGWDCGEIARLTGKSPQAVRYHMNVIAGINPARRVATNGAGAS